MNLIPKSLAKLCMNEGHLRFCDMPKEVQDLMRHFKTEAELMPVMASQWYKVDIDDYTVMCFGVYRLDCTKIGFWSSVLYIWRRCYART